MSQFALAYDQVDKSTIKKNPWPKRHDKFILGWLVVKVN